MRRGQLGFHVGEFWLADDKGYRPSHCGVPHTRVSRVEVFHCAGQERKNNWKEAHNCEFCGICRSARVFLSDIINFDIFINLKFM